MKPRNASITQALPFFILEINLKFYLQSSTSIGLVYCLKKHANFFSLTKTLLAYYALPLVMLIL
jgi:hypothetical protein